MININDHGLWGKDSSCHDPTQPPTTESFTPLQEADFQYETILQPNRRIHSKLFHMPPTRQFLKAYFDPKKSDNFFAHNFKDLTLNQLNLVLWGFLTLISYSFSNFA